MTINKGDFIKIIYTGRILDDNSVFDTTDQEIAKKEGFEKKNIEPVVIRVGDGQLIQGLDEDVLGKELNKDYSVNIIPEKAFGKKSAKLIQLVSLSKFKNENIKPMPGLQVQINDQMGIVKTVTGGRVMVDFNHPLSGKDVKYEYKILNIIKDDIEKIKSYFLTSFGIKEIDVKKTEKGFEIETKNPMPDIIKEEFNKKLKEIISDKEEYIFISKNDENKIKNAEIKKTDGKE